MKVSQLLLRLLQSVQINVFTECSIHFFTVTMLDNFFQLIAIFHIYYKLKLIQVFVTYTTTNHKNFTKIHEFTITIFIQQTHKYQ